MENKKVKASICLPAYNGEKFIRQAIESALAQTFTDFELIISDDGSTDKTEEICREYEKKNSKIRYIRHDQNRRANWNFRYVMQEAKGFYFTFLAQDDVLEKNFLTETIGYMSKHPECILVSGDFEAIDQFGKRIRLEELSKTRENIEWKKRSCEFFRYPQSKVCLFTYGLMKTEPCREILEPIKYDEKIARGTEMYQLSRLALAGQITSLPLILRKQRCHEASWYNKEYNLLKTKSWFQRKQALIKNIYTIRLDQFMVLMKSNYPISQKIYILVNVYSNYLKLFLTRLLRAPNKILRSFRKHDSE